MKIRIKTKVVLGYLITLSCGTVFFAVYFLSPPQLPSTKSRNGIERAARDSWSDVRSHERKSPLHFTGGLIKSDVLSLLHQESDGQDKVVQKQEQEAEQQQMLAVADKQIVIPPRAVLMNMSWEDLADLYHSYTQHIQVKCATIQRLGKVTDGGWEVCEDDPVKPKAPCLVYSFGVGDDFSFDDAVAKRYGCEVHSFDPSMKSKDHQRPSSVYFHAKGLANFTGLTSSGWKMATFPDLQHELGHTQRELSVLKLDIEEWEWQVLPSLLKGGHLTRVHQLLMELHQCDGCAQYNPSQLDKEPPRERYMLALSILGDLYGLGFRIFWQHQNRVCNYVSKFGWTERNACCELHLVRMDQEEWG